ncbi:host specificity protein J [Morganella morganii]|uniref:host specificity protein J n=1 Tax=Morganella morganii TaxID=582 RepID=UPI001966D1B7|nr:host specificity protein J [Morganella morganii]QSB76504.1 host specificity protein J [Morganella morganii]
MTQITDRKGGGGSPRTPVEQPDDLQSVAKAKLLIALGEGEFAGELTGKHIFLDGTPLLNADGSENFPGVVWEYRPGTQAQTYIQGMPAAENEITVGTTVQSSTPWAHAFTNPQLSAVRVRLKWPSLFRQEDNGDMVGNEVKYAIDLQTDGGSWRTVVDGRVKGKTTSGYERTHRIDLPQSVTSWTLRVRKITPDANSAKIGDTMVLQSYTEVIDAKLTYPHTALLYIEFDSKQFNGSIPQVTCEPKMRVIRVPSNYDPEHRTYSGTWDGSFKWAWTNNPAWIFYDIVISDRFGLGDRIKIQNIDKWELYRVAQYCDQPVPDGKGGSGTEPRYICDVYVQDRNEAYTVLRDFAAIFRGMTYWGGNQIITLADMPRDIDYSYTKANVLDGKFTYSGSSSKARYSSALVSYSDPLNGYADAMEPVFENELVYRFGFNQLEMTAIGCTRQSEANRKGRWGILTNNKDRVVTFGVGLDGNIPQPGYIIAVADENLSGKVTGGRVSAVNGRSITLDRKPDAAPGDRLMLNLPSGKSQARTIQMVTDNVITVTTEYSETPETECVWVTESDELYAQQYRVVSVTENDDGTFTISAAMHDPDKYDRIDTGAVLDERPISVIPPGNQFPPKDITISSYSVVNQGISIETMQVTWSPAENAIAYEAQWRRDDGNWINVPRNATTSFDVPGVYSGRYLVRVRAINAAEISSGWGYSEETRLTGKVGDPPMPLNFRAATLVFGIKLNWEFGKFTEDTLKTEIQYSKTNDGQNLLLLADVPYPSRSHELAGLAAGTAFYFRARLVDKTGNQSPWTEFVRGVAEFDASTIIDEVAAGLGDSQIIKDLQSQADDNFEAIINNANNAYGQWGYWQRETGLMKAEIIEVRNYTVTETTALAEKLDAVKVTADDSFAMAQNSIRAQWDMAAGEASVVHDMKVRIRYEGEDYSAGMVIGAELKGGEVNTLIGFNAQQFAFYNPVNKSMDLFMYMKGGQVFIREAFLDEAWIKSLLVIDKLQSENYDAGKKGFLIDAKTGKAELNDTIIRGTLYATDGEFAGTVYAQRIIGDVVTAGIYPAASAGSIYGDGGDWTTVKSTLTYVGGMPYAIALVLPTIIVGVEQYQGYPLGRLQGTEVNIRIDGVAQSVAGFGDVRSAVIFISAGRRDVKIEVEYRVRHTGSVGVRLAYGVVLACKYNSASFK